MGASIATFSYFHPGDRFSAAAAATAHKLALRADHPRKVFKPISHGYEQRMFVYFTWRICNPIENGFFGYQRQIGSNFVPNSLFN
ncbi:hypothetical protein CHUAL_001420 [Chamberlinius hualienensis]